jgi:hypothetical protein
MDMAANLRARMAERQVPVAVVASLVGRSRITVSAWRNGRTPIPLWAAQKLHEEGLIDADVLLGRAA